MISPQKILAEILVYKRNAAPFFDRDFNHFNRPVSHDPSRKQFFAKLLGAAAAVTVAPPLLAKSAPSHSTSAAPATPVVVRAEVRAVARRADSV